MVIEVGADAVFFVQELTGYNTEEPPVSWVPPAPSKTGLAMWLALTAADGRTRRAVWKRRSHLSETFWGENRKVVNLLEKTHFLSFRFQGMKNTSV